MEQLTEIKKTLFERYYKQLNEQQREAIFHVNGPLLVVAGAGSGKTTVLVNRIAHIIRFGNAYHGNKSMEVSRGELDMLREMAQDEEMSQREALAPILTCFSEEPCDPDRILAITFTNKAAGEIKERLKRELGERAGEIWAGTFHSICVRLLRRYSDYMEYSGSFTIYDQSDCKKIITTILKDKQIEDPELTPRYLMNVISRAKNALQDAETFAEFNQNSEKRRIIADVYREYQKTLTDADAMDFDDIIMETVRLLQREQNIREWSARKFRYVLVDEYQDTNHAQSLLLKLIMNNNPCPNIMAVGDDDQSIYKFRGAAVENILTFDRDYPDTKVILLEQNYRSTKAILDAANALIAHNDSRRGKKLWCANGSGKKVALRQLEDQEKEAVYIADKIGFFTMQKLYQYKDFAVLYRTKAQSNILETVFAKSGIPHRLLSGQRFYEHAEVKDMIAYLRLVANAADFVSLSRIINVPKRSIGQTTVEKIRQLAEKEGVPAFEILKDCEGYEELKRSSGKLKEFARLITGLQRDAEELTPSQLVHEIIDRSGYMASLAGEENEERRKNVDELISSARYYEERTEEATLAGFLEEIALVSEVDNYDEEANSVVLMTIHAAKGLEFPVVFLCGMEENLFPSPQSTATDTDLEEERRLAYVAMTRAKKELFLTCTVHRMIYGRTNFNEISRFVQEIPEQMLDMELCRVTTDRTFRHEDDFFLPPKRIFTASAGTAGRQNPPPKPKVPQPAAKKKVERFSVGDRVLHHIFGEGVILSAKAYGSDTMYEIRFDTAGTKKLMATYANLERKQ